MNSFINNGLVLAEAVAIYCIFIQSITMKPLHSTPLPDTTKGGCWTCAHWHGRWSGKLPVCDRDPMPIVQALPQHACAFWEREPGTDDGPIVPVPPTIKP